MEGKATESAGNREIQGGKWVSSANDRRDITGYSGPCASGSYASYLRPLRMNVLHVEGVFCISYAATYRVSEGATFLLLTHAVSAAASAGVTGIGDAETTSEAQVNGASMIARIGVEAN